MGIYYEKNTRDIGLDGKLNYYYKKLGFSLTFDVFNYSIEEAPLIMIECDVDKLELNGLTSDMSLNQIQERIGKGKSLKKQ